MIDGFWGKCDVDEGKTSCDPNWKPKPEQQTNIKSKGKYFKLVMRNCRVMMPLDMDKSGCTMSNVIYIIYSCDRQNK